MDDKREIWVISGIEVKLLAARFDFPGLKQVAFVRRTFWKEKERISEGRYFLTSLPRNRLSANRFLKSITSHWEIENSLHNVKDKHWNEDKQYTARASLGCIQSALRNLSLNILRTVQTSLKKKSESLTSKALKMLAKPLDALKMISKI